METVRTVVLCGDSVVLAGVGKSLEGCPRLRVLSLPRFPLPGAPELDSLSPDAVVLDLGMVGTEAAFGLLHDHPGLMLIGLDPGGDRLLVLSGPLARKLGTDDLVRLIEGAGVSEDEPNGLERPRRLRRRRPGARLRAD
jgi:hypothetical protein